MFGDLFDKITAPFHKKEDIELDPQLASQILSKAYEACEYEKNTVPLEVLTSYSNYRKERFLFQKTILAFCAAAFILLPLLFIAPKFSMTEKESDTSGNPYLEVVIENWMPLERISASIGGEKVPVYEMADGTYQIHPDTNGELIISAELINHQQTSKTYQIANIDAEPPVLVSSERKDGKLTLFFSDNSGTLDYENAYATTMEGEITKPLSYDETAVSVTFAYPSENINIVVSDKSDNTLNIVVTLK